MSNKSYEHEHVCRKCMDILWCNVFDCTRDDILCPRCQGEEDEKNGPPSR
jgi:hypothetical protein